MPLSTCIVCGAEFKGTHAISTYCGRKCRDAASVARREHEARTAEAAARGEPPPPAPGTDAFYEQDIEKAPEKFWKKLLDEKLYDDRRFLSLFEISTEDVDADGVIRPKKFILRPVQEELHELEDEMDKSGTGFVNIEIPKSRKHGISRHSMSRYGFVRVLRRAGYNTVIVAQDNDMAAEHHEKLNELFGQVNWEALEGMGYKRVESTRRTFAIMHPNGQRSSVKIRTASKRGLGRGGTPNAVLLTERGNAWTAEARRALPGLLSGLRRSKGNVLIDESTAGPEGNDFHRDCVSAKQGRGSARLLFFPAYRHSLNYKGFESERLRKAFEATLGDVYYGEPGEEAAARELVGRYWIGKGLATEDADRKAMDFLHWRREEIDTNCKGSVDVLHRDNPITFDEAFHGTGRPVFDNRTLRTMTQAAEDKQRTGKRGRLVEKEGGNVVFQPMPGGPLIVYRMPKKRLVGVRDIDSYCWGMDVASGRSKQSGSGQDADWTVITVDDAYTGATVAKFRDHVIASEAKNTLKLLARWYEDGDGELARGFVELGGGWGDAVINALIEDAYRDPADAVWLDMLLTSAPADYAKVKFQEQSQYGFKASKQGKQLLATRGEEFINVECRHWLKLRPDEPFPESPFDADTLTEMKSYCFDERGRMEASAGHDDCTIAKLLALHSRSCLFAANTIERATKVPEKEGWRDPLEKILTEEGDRQRGRDAVRVIVDPAAALRGSVAFKKDSAKSQDPALGSLY